MSALTVLALHLQPASAGMLANGNSDLNAPYGLCTPGGSGSGTRPPHILYVGESLAKVMSATILQCTSAVGGAPRKVACPDNTPYSYCINTGNDGQGNNVTFGILKFNTVTSPSAVYSGCRAGATLPSKLRLVELAEREPREIKAIVTLSCAAATVASATPPAEVPCPALPHPYTYCLSTPNDGKGNAVSLGIVQTDGAGDPYGLYGNCNDPIRRPPGVVPGYLPKHKLVQAVGRSLEKVRTIDLLGCSVFFNFPSAMPHDRLEEFDCRNFWFANLRNQYSGRYDYCIWGADSKGNGVAVGVNADNN